MVVHGKWGRNVLILIGINILLRTLWLLFMHPHQVSDFEWYYTHAVQMADGNGYNQYGRYTAYWPIGYPFFLALIFRLTGPSVVLGLAVNAVLSICIVLLVYGIAVKLMNRHDIALLAALGYSILPSQIEWNSVLGSEELFTALLLLFLFIYLFSYSVIHRRLTILLSGVILGLSCDVRPISLLFPLAVGVYEVWINRKSLRETAVIVLLLFVGAAITISPVTVRNALIFHQFILISTNGGVVLWQGTHADGSYYWSWNPKVNPLLAANMHYLPAKMGQIGMHYFIQHVIQHPFWTVIHGFRKWFFLYWMDDNVVGVTFMMKYPTMKWLANGAMIFDNIAYWLWMAVCILGAVKGIRLVLRSWKVIALPIAYLAYNTAIFFFFPAWDRFRYPMMPLYALLFGLGIYVIQVTVFSRKTQRFPDLNSLKDSVVGDL